MLERKYLAVLVVPMLFLAGCKGFLEFTEKVAAENGHFANAVMITHLDTPEYMDDATERKLLLASKAVAKYDDAAVDAYAAQNKLGALAQIDQALQTVDTDVASGIAGIKNDKKKLEIQAIVAALRSLLVTAKAYVQGAH